MSTNINIKKIFRFKMSDRMNDALGLFTNTNRFNERKEIKAFWKEWCTSNADLIQDESRRLENLGWNGNVTTKMWTSVRYYHMKKENKTLSGVVDGVVAADDGDNEGKKQRRRKYITLDKLFLALIDTHIKGQLNNNTFSPARGYALFVDAYDTDIQRVIKSWVDTGLSKDDFDVKLKKTYKNRYFNIVK